MLNLISIIGPTASGKTKLAAALAHKLGTSVISADSRQVYRDMTIGTGKDLDEYSHFSPPVKYHLIDIKNAGEKFNVFDFQKNCFEIIHRLNEKNETPVLCGGTGMYLDSVLLNYKMNLVPEDKSFRVGVKNISMNALNSMLNEFRSQHNTTDSLNRDRLIRAIEIAKFEASGQSFKNLKFLVFGIRGDREALKNRIEDRLKYRLENGLIEEVQRLIQAGLKKDDLLYYGLEYKFVGLHLFKDISYNDMYQQLRFSIFKFSKKQMTWFRRMEKQGINIHWLDFNDAVEKQLTFVLGHINDYQEQ